MQLNSLGQYEGHVRQIQGGGQAIKGWLGENAVIWANFPLNPCKYDVFPLSVRRQIRQRVSMIRVPLPHLLKCGAGIAIFSISPAPGEGRRALWRT
ncbi:hypothetical protein, partial [Pseudophaeobacter arcticus]|uniref:hypothetical protein n=1 Tax=Pseudophaeobacter arcticus TaxID=385492 RepID=UPI0039E45303